MYTELISKLSEIKYNNKLLLVETMTAAHAIQAIKRNDMDLVRKLLKRLDEIRSK